MKALMPLTLPGLCLVLLPAIFCLYDQKRYSFGAQAEAWSKQEMRYSMAVGTIMTISGIILGFALG